MDEALERKLQGLTPAQRALFVRLQQQQQAATEITTPIALRETHRADSYALSFAQQRFWLLEQLHPAEPAHHLAGILLLTGVLQREALQHAVDHVVARHATLRTSFRSVDGVPSAVEHDEARCIIAFEDLSNLAEPDQERVRTRLLEQCTAAPFDLSNPPMLRAQLLRVSIDRWQLFWCVHHIAADGLSMLHLVEDLQRQYESLASGLDAPPQPQPAPLSYHDFAQWTAERQQNGEFQAGRNFFEQQLRDLPSTRLQPDLGKSTANARGGRVRQPVDGEVSAALLHLARSNECTPFVTMLTGFVAALHRWTGDDDLVLGTPFANRNHPRLQRAVGLFVNSLVLRCRIEPHTTFRLLLQQVRSVVHETFVHGDVPFEHLVQQLAPERHLDRNPLFQVMFNFVDFADVDATPAGMHWQYQEAPAGTLFDFTLYVRQHCESFVLEAEYDQSLFEPATMQSRLTELHTLLQGAVLDADREIHDLPLLSPVDHDTLQRWQLGAPLPPGASDAWSLVREAVQRSPHARLADSELSMAGEELLRLVTHLGSALREHGVRPGDRVAFFLPRTRWLPITALAIWHAGAVAVPLDPAQPSERCSAILVAAAPKFVVTSRTARAPALGPRELCIEDLLQPCRAHAATDLASSAPAYLLFTSGSTGEPKGVVVAQASLAACLRAMRQTLPLQAGDTLLAITSPSFDIAWLEWLLPLYAGGAVHIATEDAARDGNVLAQELATTRATVVQATPSTYRLLLAAGFRGNAQLHLLSGGEALPDALAQQLRSCCSRLWNLYGPTETTIWSTVHEVGPGPVRIGRPIPGTDVFVVAANGQPMPIGCPGELLIAGAGLALGYDASPEATAQRFVSGPKGVPAYRTGDLVRFDSRGELQFLGRVDQQVKVRGHRIEPGAVEAWLALHADVAECAVQVVTDAGGNELVAHVVSSQQSHHDADEWRSVWQQTYEDGVANDLDFDHRGWIDSRTGVPLTTEVMRRFVDHTAARIASLGCRRVLEVGCGTGMLVAALAPGCEQWHATDATEAAVCAVASLAKRRSLASVTTQQLRADQLDQLPEDAFDCVVINSVAQYFPSLAYLLSVLAQARRVLAPGGVVFLGDVRVLPWQPAAAAWLELATATNEMPRTAIAAACDRRIASEPELLLAPELFQDLVAHGAFADCWLSLRKGDDDTEMDRFRIDVVLTTDSQFSRTTSLPAAADNARVARSWHAAALLTDASLVDVAALRVAADELAQSASIPVPDRLPASRSPCAPATNELPAAATLRRHANAPRRAQHALANELRAHLRTHLPANVVPRHIIWHEQLPRLASGKIDRPHLQATLHTHPDVAPAAANSATEQQLVTLFAEVLEQPTIGREHDFFASGGHSLGAARLAARIRETFSVDLPLRQIFANPVLHELAAYIETSRISAPDSLSPRPREAALRPGPTMQRLWFLQRLTPGSRAYLMIGVVEATQLDIVILRLALADVTARHEVLRLRLDDVQGQAVLRTTTEAVPFTHLPNTDTLQAALLATTGDAMLPLQVFCADCPSGAHRIAFVLHHAFLDGWSLAVLRRDLAEAYRARLQKRSASWPELPLQYLDFAHWQLEQRHDQAREFWQQELHDILPTLDLPTDRARPPDLQECGRRLDAPIDASLLARASVLGQQQGATTFLVFLAAYQLWLCRLSGQRDLVVGTTLANRDHAALEGAMGSFLQTLPMRGLVRDSMSFAELLAATKQTFLRCTEHQGLPFQQLVDAVEAPRLLNRTPLFQATLDWLNHPDSTDKQSGGWRERDHDPNTSKFELSVVVTSTAPFTAYLEYRSDLFDVATIESWWQSFACLLRNAVTTPNRSVGELPWLENSQQHYLLEQGRGEAREWPLQNVVSAWQDRVAQTPNAIAIRADGKPCTYASAHERVLQIAATLQHHGAQPGQRIALCLPRSSEQLFSMLAVLHVGCAYVPIAPDQPPLRAADMLACAEVTLAVCTATDRPPSSTAPVRWCTTTATEGPVFQPCTIEPTSLAYVLFTSGSTGQPKGVAVSHRALANYVFWASEHYGSPQSAPLHTPLSFDLTLTSIWPIWLAGGSVHIASKRGGRADGNQARAPKPSGIEALLAASQHGPFAIAKLTPSHLDAWQAGANDRRLADGLVLGGEALQLAQLRVSLANNVRIWNEYGPTEATVGCACREILAADGDQGPAPIGVAIANTRLYVLDSQRQLVPRGVVGELFIAGHSLANGYAGRDDLTEQSFCPDPFAPGERMYQSGDHVSWHSARGGQLELHFHGRKDDQYKIRGHRIELGEVRACLLRLEAIRDAVATVQQAPSGSEQLIAYVVGTATPDWVRDQLQHHLPPHAIPTHVVSVSNLPIDRNGKLDLARLPSPWRDVARPASVATAASDRESVELLRLASDLLQVPDLRPDDDFFRSGGDSILALQLVARAADLGLQLEIREVFEHPTVASLRRVARNAEKPLTAPDRGGLLPMQQWFFAQHFEDPTHYDQALWLRYLPTEATDLRAALHAVVARHHALRTAFVERDGAIEQQVQPHGEFAFVCVDLRAHDQTARERTLTAIANASNFDPITGQVFAATLVRLDAKTHWLYLRAHHLAVDAISWVTILTDLQTALAGEPLPAAPPPPLAFLASPSAPIPVLPATHDQVPCTQAGLEGNTKTCLVTFSTDELRGMHAAKRGPHRIEVLEMLASAAAQALPNPGKQPLARVDIEGHGRLAANARTVGWFTEVYGVTFDVRDASESHKLRLAKQCMREADRDPGQRPPPEPAAPILLNYLGAIFASSNAEGALQLLDHDAGMLRAAANQRSHPFELRALERDGELRVTCHAPDATLANQVAIRFAEALRRLVDATSTATAELSYADYPLATLPHEQTLALLAGRGDIDQLYPLTPTQQGMLFSALKHPDAPVYREQLAAVIEGPLQVNPLQQAFAMVSARHELLRGEVHWRGLQEPHWLIPRTGQLPFARTQLRCHEGEAEATAVRRRLAELREARFAFGTEPLLRIEVAQLGTERHALLVTYHHVILDGWSMPLLLREAVHHYRGLCGESMPPLPAAQPFAEHVAFLSKQCVEDQQSFWQNRLAGFREPPHLRGDRTRSPSQLPSYGECERWLSKTQSAALQHAAEQQRITISTLLQTAWAVVLARWSGRDDVLFGVTVAGRPPELTDVAQRIGLFINTLPLRVRLDANTSTAELLAAVQRDVVEMLAHQHTPLPVSQAQSNVPVGTDPFETLLVFENYPLEESMRELPAGLRVVATTAYERTSYALTLVAIPGEQLCLRLLHQDDRFSSEFAEQLLRSVETVLQQLASNPRSATGDLDWLTTKDHERAAQLAVGPTAHHEPHVLQRVLATARSCPNAIAISANRDGLEHAITYQQLADNAERIARHLVQQGVTADSLVAFRGERNAEAIATLLGIWRSGAAYLPIDPQWPEQQVADILAASRPCVFLDAASTPASPATDACELPEVRDMRALAYAIATSGTTGRPKIVRIEHASVANYVGAAIRQFELTASDRVLQFASFAFDTAAEEIWPTLCVGATLVLRNDDQADSSRAFLHASREQGVTVWDLPTAFFHSVFVPPMARAHDDLGNSLRLCIIGGQAADALAVHTFHSVAPNVRLLNTYGPSEATIVATWCELQGAHTTRPPIGTPVPGTEAWVLDRELRPVPPGVPGELCLLGAGLARDYIDAAATRERFVLLPDGRRAFRTGDLARHRGDGQLAFLGRLDRQLKIAGVRVEPDAVEACLLQYPTVTEACVRSIAAGPDAHLVAFLETPDTNLTESTVRTFLRAHLPTTAIPTQVIVQAALPRLVSGKVDLQALRAPTPPAVAQPTNDDEAAVVAIFTTLFGNRAIAAEDDFFDLGGSSLVAVRLLDALHAQFDVDLTIQALFADPTPRGIARAVRSPPSAANAVPVEQMRADAKLAQDFIVADKPTRAIAPNSQQVVLTGATGFFGRYVLRELLRGDVEHVHCLVRAADPAAARERLAELLAATGTPIDSRVTVLCGDVAKPEFGLAGSVVESLGKHATSVVHVAAQVDFLRPYAQLRAANVEGTRNVVTFCARYALPLHHVSSIGVFADPRASKLATIDESRDLACLDRPIGGYAQSKWVSEQLVRTASLRGLQTTIHRPGRLVADSQTGRGNDHDFVTAMLTLCRDLGKIVAMPALLDQHFDVTPVDYAARVLVASLATKATVGETMHLVHPEPPSLATLLELLRDSGWQLQPCDWLQFRAAATQFLATNPSHAATALLPFLQTSPVGPQKLTEPRFGCERTLSVLGANAPTCPAIDQSLMARWLRGLAE